jgi:hypothetical protein
MPEKKQNLEELMKAAERATAKTRLLLEEAHNLHESLELAHERTQRLRARITQQRAKARKAREQSRGAKS